MAFGLELEAAGRVGDAFAAVVAPIDAGVRAAPDLVDRLVGVHLWPLKYIVTIAFSTRLPSSNRAARNTIS